MHSLLMKNLELQVKILKNNFYENFNYEVRNQECTVRESNPHLKLSSIDLGRLQC
jgi:hypothetical protein